MANTQPIFTLTPVHAQASLSAANTERIYSSGTLVNVVTGGTSGTRIFRIIIKATATTTAGMVRLWVYDGATNKLFREYVVSAITVGAAVKSWETEEAFYDLVLPASYILKASTHNAETFNVFAEGGDF